MIRRQEPTRTAEQKDLTLQGPRNERARGGGARVCHEQGREDSTGAADWSIKSAELVERCPPTTRRLVKIMQGRLPESEVADVRHETAERSLASRTKGPRRQSKAMEHDCSGGKTVRP